MLLLLLIIALSVRYLIGIIVLIALLFRLFINVTRSQSLVLKALIRFSQRESAFNFFTALKAGLKDNIYKNIATELGFSLIGNKSTKIFI